MSATIAELERRLNAGWEMCEREADLNERVRLEDHWLRLLRQYEQLVDAARRAQDNRRDAA